MRLTALLLAFQLASSMAIAGQGSLLLVGGGSEDYNDWSDAPYRWLVTHAANRRILVLHYADTSAFFSGYFPWLSPCTVANRAVTSRVEANDSSLYEYVLGFDGIFLRGGDQWLYVTLWRGTLVARAIQEVYARGGVIGGTSAGEAVLGEIVFDARQTSVAPRTALRNPFAAGITLTDDFLDLGANLIPDSHFFERGRLGRLPAFLAFYKQASGREIMGIGVEYGTALGIGPDGTGEVMGSGTVSILRYTPDTRTVLTSGSPLSMHGLRLDQLTAGGRFSLTDGSVTPPPDGFLYEAVQWSAPPTTVILDGGNALSEWSLPAGSLARFQATVASPDDTVGIISSSSGASVAANVAGVLSGRSMHVRTLIIGDGKKNDPGFAQEIDACRGIIFVANAIDSLAACLDPATLAGKAFSDAVIRHSPVLFLSDDVMLAGDQGVGQLYRSIYGAYYGYLVPVPGLGIIRGFRCIPRLYEASDYIDNRASALFWSMAQGRSAIGLLLDNASFVTLTGDGIEASGATPVMVVDARNATHGSVPAFRDPGKTGPRQLGGIVGARFHVVRNGETIEISSSTSIDGEGVAGSTPREVRLYPNYPNPFNPSTAIRYELPVRTHVNVSIHDVLGRMIAQLSDGEEEAGVHERRFTPDGLASGVYLCTVRAGGFTLTRVMMYVQ
jgi:cyanophycinase